MTKHQSDSKPGHGKHGPDPDRPIPAPSAFKIDRRRSYTPWLVVRAEAGDEGARPLPAGEVFWESPDVWTEGSHGINQPVVNEPTHVFARIGNLGLEDATGVVVKFWWANPSLAITEQTAHLIGSGTAAILSNNALVFECPTPWVPVFENSGHECLIAQASIPVFDPLTDPMTPVNDRHVGQKNETVLVLPQARTFELDLEAFNFTARREHVIIEARRGVVPRDFATRFARKAPWPKTLVDPARALPVELEVQREFLRILPTAPASRPCGCGDSAGAGSTFRYGTGTGFASDCLGPALATEVNVFHPGEVRRVTVRGALPATARPGDVYVVRITQRIGQQLSGGYTLYVTPDPHAK